MVAVNCKKAFVFARWPNLELIYFVSIYHIINVLYIYSKSKN